MTPKPVRDVAASVRARLVRLAHQRNEEAELTFLRYVLERFLYRLSRSPHGESVVVKGATLMAVWGGPAYRPTRDVDLLGRGSSSPKAVARLVRDVCAVDVRDDGVRFDLSTLTTEPLRADDEYPGVRAELTARLGSARIAVQIDVAFGQAVKPRPSKVEFPTLLDFPAPRLLAYPREVVVAEKSHAMVVLGMRNSRMKDFHDVWTLARSFAFDGRVLAGAFEATFERRRTPIPGGLPVAFTPGFWQDPDTSATWRAFCARSRLSRDAILLPVVGGGGPRLRLADPRSGP